MVAAHRNHERRGFSGCRRRLPLSFIQTSPRNRYVALALVTGARSAWERQGGRPRSISCSARACSAPIPSGENVWWPRARRRRKPRSSRARSEASDEPTPAPSGRHWAWADLMRRVFDIDVLACPRCGRRLRLMATVEDPGAIRAILAAVAGSPELVERARPFTASPDPGPALRSAPEHYLPPPAARRSPPERRRTGHDGVWRRSP
jgi:hypothetical protein